MKIATKAGVFEEMILPRFIVEYDDIDSISKHLWDLLNNQAL